jgi:hypothetical protein
MVFVGVENFHNKLNKRQKNRAPEGALLQLISFVSDSYLVNVIFCVTTRSPAITFTT